MRLIDADELVEYLKQYHGMSQGVISDVEHFPSACNVNTMEAGLHKLMGEDYSNCVGATRKDGCLAFYHERGLYSVEHEDSGIVSLVYAKNPYEAIEKVAEELLKG